MGRQVGAGIPNGLCNQARPFGKGRPPPVVEEVAERDVRRRAPNLLRPITLPTASDSEASTLIITV